MVFLHEPARLVGTDGQKRQTERSVPGRCLPEDGAITKGRISRQVELAIRRVQHKGGPEGAAPVPGTAGRPVQGRGKVHPHISV